MTRLYFVLCLVFTCSVSGQSPTYGLMGLKVTLKPDVTATKQPDEILWKHNGNKVVEFDGRKQQDFGLFENRVTLDWISAELSITDLRLDDSGEYDLEVYADKVLKRQTLNLVVLEKLAKPNIKCEMSKGSSSTDGEEATLTCSVESRQPLYLTYEWIYQGPGQRLTVPLSDKNKEYTCMVRSRLSNATAKVTTKACYPDEGLSAPIIGLIVAVILSVAAIGVVVGIIIYCKKNNKGRKQSSCESLDNVPTIEKSKADAEQLDPPDSEQETEAVPVKKRVQDIERKQAEQQKQIRLMQPTAGTRGTPKHTKGADSSQVTGRTKKENVELSEPEKNNDPNKNSQIGKSVSDQTKSDNNQSLSPPSPEKPDQSNCGEVQESPDATHSDLDQQTQDKTGCDSSECEEQSDNTTVTKGDKGKDGDTDDNEDQCSGELKQSDKESENKDTQETRLEQSDNTTVSKGDKGKEEGDTDDNEGQCSAKLKQSDKESEDTEETMLVEQSDEESESEDTEETRLEQSDDTTTVTKGDSEDEGDTDDNGGQCSAELKQSDKESDDEDTEKTRLEQSDEESEDEDREDTMLLELSDNESEDENTEETSIVKQPDKGPMKT